MDVMVIIIYGKTVLAIMLEVILITFSIKLSLFFMIFLYFRYFSTLQSLCKRKFSTIYIIPEARLINLCKRLQNIFSDQFCVVMLFQMILSDIDIKFYHQLFDTSKELSKLDRLGIKTS